LTRHTFHLAEGECPLRLDLFLARQPGLGSRTQARKLIDEGRVWLNGAQVQPGAKVRFGDTVEVEVLPAVELELLPEPIPLTIIYEDQDLVVVDKPAGLLTHPTPGHHQGTLVNALLYHCPELSGMGGKLKPGIVHRLDKLTSGVMVVAKSDRAHRGLANQFKAHSIERRYLAVVMGEMSDLSGSIAAPISRNPRHSLRMTSRRQEGRQALTHFRVLSRHQGLTLVELKLETGRTHQIRVHLSERNHPVLGDTLYSQGRTLPGPLPPEQSAALHRLTRQALHAYFLGFSHPVTDEDMAFASPLPADLARVTRAFGLGEAEDLPARPARVR
jgi:23S rRNA pseudouridine1911/1915/1917 synthase